MKNMLWELMKDERTRGLDVSLDGKTSQYLERAVDYALNRDLTPCRSMRENIPILAVAAYISLCIG